MYLFIYSLSSLIFINSFFYLTSIVSRIFVAGWLAGVGLFSQFTLSQFSATYNVDGLVPVCRFHVEATILKQYSQKKDIGIVFSNRTSS